MKIKEFYNTTAWKWFRKYVMLHYSKDGVCQCSTCGSFKQLGDSKLHLGHLIKVFDTGGKTNFSTAFDERNCAPQCYQCNVKAGGRELKMLEFIENKFGEGTYDKLKELARTPMYGFRMELPSISDHYRNKYNELKKVKG